MEQRRFWGKRRDWSKKKFRPRAIEFNATKKIFEPVEREEDVVVAIISTLWYSGIPVFRERERIPKCPKCGQYVSRTPSDAGHPDLHGYIPATKTAIGQAAPFYIEVKRPSGGVETEVQKEFIRRAQGNGVLAFFARSVNEVRAQFASVGVELVGG